jgi:hypothetical protein
LRRSWAILSHLELCERQIHRLEEGLALAILDLVLDAMVDAAATSGVESFLHEGFRPSPSREP